MEESGEGGEGGPPRKVPRREDPRLAKLQRGAEAGRKVVQLLQQVVPLAVDALHRQLDASVARLRQVEEALADLEQAAPHPAEQLLQLAVQLEDHNRVLNANKCSVVAEEVGGAASWRSSVQLGPLHHLARLLLLQQQIDGELVKVDVAGAAVPPAGRVAPDLDIAVGPPRLSVEHLDLRLSMTRMDEVLKWPACDLEKVQVLRRADDYDGSNRVASLLNRMPHLEQVHISDAQPRLMNVVKNMKSLRRLVVKCKKDGHPDLPLQLEELGIVHVCENHLLSVQRMPRLRSLFLEWYHGPDVTFPPVLHCGLQWLGLSMYAVKKPTMLSLVRAHAASLLELEINCGVGKGGYYHFPDLAADLAACELQVLRRLVLVRRMGQGHGDDQVNSCDQQRVTIRGSLPGVQVICSQCHEDSWQEWLQRWW
ncbi:uncharacterized protein LOC113211640 [Frankliniella occidentalis]|uniref:Uncharacterized protein LOC113211640 n=1 Tax=Frankliniella occidentalis TaxID=133901 RepID=A0A9C6XW12_FRAOC|nr:uncharacterized protein LOC113211640 [Frankliniella occidentalis]